MIRRPPPTAPASALWAPERRRLTALMWLRHYWPAVWADMRALYRIDRPLELPIAEFVALAGQARHYNGAVAAAHGTDDTSALARILQPRPAAPTPAPVPAAAGPKPLTARGARSMGIPRTEVSDPKWGDHWVRLAAANGLDVPQEVTDAR